MSEQIAATTMRKDLLSESQLRRFLAALRPAAQSGNTDINGALWYQSTPASVKVRAAECVMTHSAKAIEIEDIEARVSELERAAGPQKARP